MFECLYSNLRTGRTLHSRYAKRKRFEYKHANSLYAAGMQPQRTSIAQPIQLRIADDLRMQIESGELPAGASLPTLAALMEQYGCSMTPARNAVELLKQQGLVLGGRGHAPVVRPQPRRVERSSDRHQAEKDMVRETDAVRGGHGLAEDDIGVAVDDLDFRADYDTVPAGDLATLFGIDPADELFRRFFEHRNPQSGNLEAWSVSWVPTALIAANPAIMDPANKKWPGGTMHQLYTVGIEIAEVIDQVSAAMPTTVEAQNWDLPDGIPLLWVRRISKDTLGRVAEISDAQYPADRTLLTFRTALAKWEDNA